MYIQPSIHMYINGYVFFPFSSKIRLTTRPLAVVDSIILSTKMSRWIERGTLYHTLLEGLSEALAFVNL